MLVPNLQGYERARAVGAEEIAVFTAASEAFNRKNINASIDESIDRFAPVLERARADGVNVRGYVSTVLGCPYQGDVPVADVVRVAARMHALGCYEISLGDTIGIGTPAKARAMLRAVAAEVPMSALAVHFHDTRGQALANILACLEEGVAVVDSSVSGTGGCPYAKGATGNVASGRCRLHARRDGHCDGRRSREADRDRAVVVGAAWARDFESRGARESLIRSSWRRWGSSSSLVIPAEAGIQFSVIPAKAGIHFDFALAVSRRCRENRLTSVCVSSAIHGGRLLSFACPKERKYGDSERPQNHGAQKSRALSSAAKVLNVRRSALLRLRRHMLVTRGLRQVRSGDLSLLRRGPRVAERLARVRSGLLSSRHNCLLRPVGLPGLG